MSPRVFVEEVVGDLYVLRVDDNEIKYFEALWDIPEKITYNAYLLVGDEERVLFDGWKTSYADDLIEAVKSLIDPKDITHIVLHHMEPDHSGSLPKVLEANKFKAEVIAHPMAKSMIEAFYGISPLFRSARDGEEISIAGEKIKFLHTPWLHWPETIMSYLTNRGILLTCDAFGGFSIPRTLFDEDGNVIEEYLPAVRRYVASIVGHYRQYITRNIEKIQKLGLKINAIAPGHGIIWKKDPMKIVEYYLKLAEGVPEKGKVLVVYASMYGAIKQAIDSIVEELNGLDKNPVIYDFTDRRRQSLTSIIGDAIDSEAIVIAAPTYEADAFPTIKYVATLIAEKIPPKPVLIASSYGWGSAAAKKISEILSRAGFKIAAVVDFRGTASEEDLEKIREGVRKLMRS